MTERPDGAWIVRATARPGAGAPAPVEGADVPRVANPLISHRLKGELDARFGGLLDDRRVAGTGTGPIAAALAQLAADDQYWVLARIDATLESDREVALAFAARAPEALARMDREGVNAWLLGAMDAFDRRGLGAALAALDALPAFAQARADRVAGLAFDDASPVLVRFLAGLGGRPLRLATMPEPWTDTATVWLPALLTVLPRPADNFRVYRAMALHAWAQAWYGTWRVTTLAHLRRFEGRTAALATWTALERERLDACIARDLPGAGRDIEALAAVLDVGRRVPAGWTEHAAPVREPRADAGTSLALVASWGDRPLPDARFHHGPFRPDAVLRVLEERTERERRALHLALGRLRQEFEQAGRGDRDAGARPAGRQFSLASGSGTGGRSGLELTLEFEGRAVAPPADVAALLASVRQDLGEVPPEHLVAAAPAAYAAGDGDGDGAGDAPAYRALFDEAGTHVYPEWDHVRRAFRPGYCTLREQDVEPADEAFVAATLARHAGLVKSIRRTFEAMVEEVRRLRRQAQGDDIDLEALVEAGIDARLGREPDERVYTRLARAERNVAVMFMIDMSGSTKGWVNDAEREALVLLCEALERLGDRYAIYGFSGRTHKRCEVYRVKRFDEPYGPAVRGRVSGIRPKGYTRMGAAIRHLGGLLAREEARTRLLVTLSDGKPEDYRSYRGAYGIEDTRHALLELRRAGIHPYCITIDREGGDYLPHMYGAANYAVIDDVARLPLRIADIYRRLTT